MWEQIMNLAISNGLFAVLFSGLLVYQLKDSRLREQKYQSTIEKLGDSLEIVKQVKEDVEDIKMVISDRYIKKSKTKDNNDEEKI